jgi:hypothetical protein
MTLPTEIVSPAPLAGGNRADFGQAEQYLPSTTIFPSLPAPFDTSIPARVDTLLGWTISPVLMPFDPSRPKDDPTELPMYLATGEILVVEIDRKRFSRSGRFSYSVAVSAVHRNGAHRFFSRAPRGRRVIHSQQVGDGIKLYGAGDLIALPPDDGWDWLFPPDYDQPSELPDWIQFQLRKP